MTLGSERNSERSEELAHLFREGDERALRLLLSQCRADLMARIREFIERGQGYQHLKTDPVRLYDDGFGRFPYQRSFQAGNQVRTLSAGFTLFSCRWFRS